MKGKTLYSRGRFHENPAFTQPHKRDEIVSKILPTGYSSLPQFVAKNHKNWFIDIDKALHLSPDGTFDWLDGNLLFLEAAMIPKGHQSYPYLKRDRVLFLAGKSEFLFGRRC